MKALRDVDTARLKDDIQVARELGELQKLQSVVVGINCKSDSPILPVLAVFLGKLHSLRRLDISHWDVDNGDMTFLHDLPTPPRLLRFLSISCAVLNQLPNWVGSLTYLVEFHIARAGLVGDHLFDVLCKLPNLKSIWMLYRCYRGEELVARTSHSFPALSNLIVDCAGIPEPKVIRFEQGSMTRLQTLLVEFGNLQERSIVGIEHLTGLKEVELWGKKDNLALHRCLDMLKDENSTRYQKFQVVVKYW